MTEDKAVRAARFSKAANTYDANASVQEEIGRRLFSLIPDASYQHILEVGCGTGTFSKKLLELAPATLKLSDISSGMLDVCRERFKGDCRVSFLQADCEHEALGGNYSLIASNCAVQWFSSLDEGLCNLKKSLADDGVLVFSTFVKGTMQEIRSFSGSGIEYLSESDLRDVVDRYFNKVQISAFTIKSHYDSAHLMLRSLRASGVTGTSKDGITWTLKRLKDFETEYEDRFKDPEGVFLSWNCALVIAQR